MRVPLSWLRDYVAWDRGAEELAELLSMTGSEVEGIDWVGAPRDAENLALFVVGRVVARDRHPNADKLSLCRVEVGKSHGGVRQIVCGADNFQAGDVVAVSLTGATLENGLKLKKANLRGVESDGMMLSEKELGYEAQSPGIVVLPGDWRVGAPLSDYLPVAEAVLEIEVTPNRADCFCVYGIAREVAAAAQLPLAPPPLAEPRTEGAAASTAIAVEIADPDLCTRYGARVIRGVTVAESPAWMKARLTHAGMRPINNVVDVTNFAMLAVGQPLHAFDATKIRGDALIARRSRPGETIVTLDGIERRLQPDNLVIADRERPLVIAGIFGAIDAEVDEHTTDLVLEAATFSGRNIMRTSRDVGWRSEASTRFEKGLDAGYVPQGLAMASGLFAELCGGAVAPGTVDVWGARPPAPPRLAYRPARCDALLGVAVEPAEQAAILRRVECAVEDGGDELAVTPPSFRPDLEREVDLIEEVGRLHGLEHVPETLPRRRDAVGALTKAQRLRRKVRETLVGAGLDEVVTYSFLSREALAWLELDQEDRRATPVVLANPMSAEHAVMRTTLLPGLLGVVRDNLAQQNYPLSLFEQGRTYFSAGAGEDARAGAPAPWPMHEVESLAVVLCGPTQHEDWTGAGRETDFYTAKGVVERALAALGLHDMTFERSSEPFLHPGMSAVVMLAGAPLGYVGLVRADIAARFGIDEAPVYAAELSLQAVVGHALEARLFEDLVTYPAASQDLAVLVSSDVSAAQVLDLSRRAGGKLLRGAAIFDVYEGGQVPAGKRSLALRLTMRSPERTLTDKDIGGVRQKVLAALERELGATLR